MKSVLVYGASENRARYSNMAIKKLVEHGYPVYALGLKTGVIGETPIQTTWPMPGSIHTISLYVGSARLKAFHEQLISLAPKRIIFNPGTESQELMLLAKNSGIEVIEDCTLLMLDYGRF